MKKFRFKFETVLKLRETREEEALRALGGAQRAHQAELLAKTRLSAELRGALERRDGLGRGQVSILALRTEQDFIDGTKRRIARADQAIMRASRSVEKALRSYLHCRRQTRMMERLYEAHHEEYRRALAKRERKELDDLTVMRARLVDEEGEVA